LSFSIDTGAGDKSFWMLKNVLHIIMVAMATYFPHQIFVKKEKFSNQAHS
jgi:hypothetical protein